MRVIYAIGHRMGAWVKAWRLGYRDGFDGCRYAPPKRRAHTQEGQL